MLSQHKLKVKMANTVNDSASNRRNFLAAAVELVASLDFYLGKILPETAAPGGFPSVH